MAYYHDLVTEKSWEELKKLSKSIDLLLIGGWAVYLYTKALKSKDIDILIEYSELIKLKKDYELNKNERLLKYEARREEIQIDIYLPHYSNIGIPIEDLIKQKISLEGFMVIKKEYLIALKLFTLKERGRTPKGKKDFLDLLSLFLTDDIDIKQIYILTNKYKLGSSTSFFEEMLNEYVEVPEIGLNKHLFKKLKVKILKSLVKST
ncbi:MAG: hypothetical protein UR39_C0011G0014 [Candidatus Woesebacteria bacterium GW2011_GWA1_33_30]|uniref:Uncharacterized protein n=1 Tax=Candidatus Woesebacteria bacterium GW2011_GWA2_33_28 TaxID=1618561 RepID=A0A0G0CSS8_9BACT|nr:MAG: hypothetical protein UR38_C0011G0012 [Candidatus Woesebacteria bacterium GW2011_GWA2_33_28]KKP47062.1 MAG: hypothetical protein UR39_C0011G0014 [Candidatus Woesebacteria bacterium GW2011_GWA1_33_30]KKP48676.1 MAG: hypothetical protein UR40_C0012G0012 [Microgenomates group bacterium GW2011_GWC1_33_32]KKP51385.1 MAG: hypothetical protein UR44_C0011G0012 [Candidatus Woesebacteria bacterium GW2011_GWB1_33_38]